MRGQGAKVLRQGVGGQGESPTGALDALANAMRKSGQAFKVE